MLKQRLLTAITLGPLLLWAFIALPDVYYASLLGVIVILAAKEWTVMARLENVFHIPFLIAFLVSVYFCWWALQHIAEFPRLILTISCTWWVVGFIVLSKYNRGQKQILFNPIMRVLLGFIILLPTFSALYMLRATYGAGLLVYLLFLIWFADSGAYFAGKRWGKHKLLPNVSPGKTWQGVAGAFVASIGFSLIFGFVSDSIADNQYAIFVLLSFITVIFSIQGDLIESMFKRQVNIKDSGQLLPGHGGMLDRIDSLTAAAPIFITGMLLMDAAL